MRPLRGLGQVVHRVTLLNTDSNLINTNQRANDFKTGRPNAKAVGKEMAICRQRFSMTMRATGYYGGELIYAIG
jgi:hypothetical protein